MSYGYEREWGAQWTLADQASADTRADFINKTYYHLGGAIVAFVGLEALLLNTPLAPQLTEWVVGFHRFGWLLFLGAFMVVSYVAERWAQSSTSLGTQYLGLGLYVAAEAVLFVPLLYLAGLLHEDIIPTAGLATLVIFAGLTLTVVVTRKNFSFLGPALSVCAMAALALILCSALFGFSLGLVFVVAMLVLASGYIVYHTSQVLHEYHVGQHVAASLALFASVALLFWYMVQFVMALTHRD